MSSSVRRPSSMSGSSAISSGLPANADGLAYGESPKPVGPSGSTCHSDWRAPDRYSRKVTAAGPRSPMPKRPGNELGCSNTPARRRSSFFDKWSVQFYAPETSPGWWQPGGLMSTRREVLTSVLGVGMMSLAAACGGGAAQAAAAGTVAPAKPTSAAAAPTTQAAA